MMRGASVASVPPCAIITSRASNGKNTSWFAGFDARFNSDKAARTASFSSCAESNELTRSRQPL